MTLRRTIHRREARKRARTRRNEKPSRMFLTPDWLIADRLAEVRSRLAIADYLNRTYGQ